MSRGARYDGQMIWEPGATEPRVWFCFTADEAVAIATHLSVHDRWRDDLIKAAAGLRSMAKHPSASALSAPIRGRLRAVETIEVTDGTT